jgi:putative membrane protein
MRWPGLFCRGICMGIADIIPGVSGGTMAYITGIYDQLLSSIRTVDGQALRDLLLLRWRRLFARVAWRFLLPLVSGIALAFLAAAPLVTYLLNHPVYHAHLMGLFLGLIITSAWLCGRETGWGVRQVGVALLAVAAAWAIASPELSRAAAHSVQFDLWVVDPWVICCGCAAAIAMLLPGISGSYLLTILGLYSPAMAALSRLLDGFSWDAIVLLANLAVGILLGLAIGARGIRWLLQRYRGWTLAALTGFMVGALRSVWPFWHTQVDGMGLQLLDPIWPSFSIGATWLTLCFVGLGGLLVWLVELLAHRKKEKQIII